MKLTRISKFNETFEPKRIEDREEVRQQMMLKRYRVLCQDAINFQNKIDNLPLDTEGKEDPLYGKGTEQCLLDLMRDLKVVLPVPFKDMEEEFFLHNSKGEFVMAIKEDMHKNCMVYYSRENFMDVLESMYKLIYDQDVRKYFEKHFSVKCSMFQGYPEHHIEKVAKMWLIDPKEALQKFKLNETFEPRKIEDRDVRKEENEKKAYADMCKYAREIKEKISNLPKKGENMFDSFVIDSLRNLDVVVPEYKINMNGQFYLMKDWTHDGTPEIYAIIRDYNVVIYNYYLVLEPLCKRWLFDRRTALKIIKEVFKTLIPDLRNDAFQVGLKTELDDIVRNESDYWRNIDLID